MALTKAQEALWQKARSLGSGGQAVGLTEAMCAYLVGRIAIDLGLSDTFPELPGELPDFFRSSLSSLALDIDDPKQLFARLVASNADSDTFFACLAALHKARLKYERILSTQPFPTLEQVGPRGLLQYGKLGGEALAALLFWRKWFYDIDNRAAQETGYLFEPIIAHAIGGTPAPAGKSPVKRHRDGGKGRQVDCLLDDRAYELKIRVTIAASGQGRWREELDFPLDCKRSGFKPILVCMDGTPNDKLKTLVRAFEAQNGEAYVGDAAWEHLESKAGETMSLFLENYVRLPIQDLLEKSSEILPDLTAKWTIDHVELTIGQETLRIDRSIGNIDDADEDELPEDAAGEIGES